MAKSCLKSIHINLVGAAAGPVSRGSTEAPKQRFFRCDPKHNARSVCSPFIAVSLEQRPPASVKRRLSLAASLVAGAALLAQTAISRKPIPEAMQSGFPPTLIL